MTRLLARWWVWLVAAALAAPDAVAQPSDGWAACRKVPTRACVFAEAVQRLRDDAPARDVPRFAVWESGLYVRLSEVAEAKKDRTLFADAKRVVNARAVLEGARETALRTIAQAEARAGFVGDAAKTIAGIRDPGPVPAEMAVSLAMSGRVREALEFVGGTSPPTSRAWAWIRLARATRDPLYLQHASASIRDVDDAYEHSSLSRHLAVAQADLGRVDDALRTIRDIGMRAYEALGLAEIARLTGNPLYLDKARRRAAGLDDRLTDFEVWRTLVRAEIALGRLSGALDILKRPGRAFHPGTLADDAGELAAAYWISDGPKKAEAILNEVLNGYADRFWGPARYALAVGLADAGRFDSALLMAFLSDEGNVDWALAHIAVRRAGLRAFNDALDTADRIKDPGARSPALAKIAALLPEDRRQ